MRLTGILLIAFMFLFGCDEAQEAAQQTANEAVEAAAEQATEAANEAIAEVVDDGPTAEDLPMPEDFEEEAAAEISADNYAEALGALEAELNADETQ